MLGIILCGGKSSRMGQDKGLIKVDTKSWAEIAAEKLARLQIPVVLSVNTQQIEKYRSEIPYLQTIEDMENLKIGGPLCGILSVHYCYPNEDVFVLACDMLNMEQHLLETLVEVYNRTTQFDSFIYADGINPEPLCGIYQTGFLELIMKKLLTGKLERHSMKFALEQGRNYIIEINEVTRKYFRSFNNIENLKDLDPHG